jgi:transposase
LPGREGHVGVTAKDNRLFVEAVLYRYRAGIPWRDLPERFGDPIKIHTRFSRWAKSGIWRKMFEMLAADADGEYAMIDSTIGGRINTAPAPQKKTAKTKRSGAAKAG